jgi:hypothetical protein
MTISYESLTPQQRQRCDSLWQGMADAFRDSGLVIEENGDMEDRFYRLCVEAAATCAPAP